MGRIMKISVPGPIPTQDIIDSINAKQLEMKRAFLENDPSWIAEEFYANHAWVFGGSDTWQGKDEILSLYQTVCGAYVWSYESINMMHSGDSVLDFIYGRIDSTSDAGFIEYKILFVWQKIDGDWKCVTQMFAEGTW